MVPPQSESVQLFLTPHYMNDIYSHKIEDVTGESILSKRKLTEEYINFNSNSSIPEDIRNGKADIFYLRAREIVLASGSLPSELEFRETGVFAKLAVCKGTRYGPFQGKWASVPQDPRFAWEVSQTFFQISLSISKRKHIKLF